MATSARRWLCVVFVGVVFFGFSGGVRAADEEISTGIREWWEKEIFPHIRAGNCEPRMEIASYPQGNNMPVTVDQHGVITQGIVDFDFCGDGSSYYLLIYEEGMGWNPAIEKTYRDVGHENFLGPINTFQVFSNPLPPEVLGSTSEGSAILLRKLFLCMQKDDQDTSYPVAAIPISRSVAKDFWDNYVVFADPESFRPYEGCQLSVKLG